MKPNMRFWLVITTVITLMVVVAFAATPGSDQDPLVTMSYVEKRWQTLQQTLVTEVDALKKSLASLEQKVASLNTAIANTNNANGQSNTLPPTNSVPVTPSIFEANTFEQGTQILLGKGSELIVRRGDSVVIDPTGNALPDLTDGLDLPQGAPVPLNHLLLCPKEDGRGILAMGTITVMIKGKYQILPAIKE